jgi:hypothetical protein
LPYRAQLAAHGFISTRPDRSLAVLSRAQAEAACILAVHVIGERVSGRGMGGLAQRVAIGHVAEYPIDSD